MTDYLIPLKIPTSVCIRINVEEVHAESGAILQHALEAKNRNVWLFQHKKWLSWLGGLLI